MEPAVTNEVFALKNIRLWFKKYDEAKFISHLDLNRVMARTIKLAKIPIWYTEGFNPHAFIVFPLPLSLGFTGERECMDIKIKDVIDENKTIELLNSFLPKGLKFYDITDPIMKGKDISYAKFKIILSSPDFSLESIKKNLDELLSIKNIIVEKKSKSGIKKIDIRPYINDYNIYIKDEGVNLDIILPAGNNININPMLIINELKSKLKNQIFYDVLRCELMNKEMKPFI